MPARELSIAGRPSSVARQRRRPSRRERWNRTVPSGLAIVVSGAVPVGSLAKGEADRSRRPTADVYTSAQPVPAGRRTGRAWRTYVRLSGKGKTSLGSARAPVVAGVYGAGGLGGRPAGAGRRRAGGQPDASGVAARRSLHREDRPVGRNGGWRDLRGSPRLTSGPAGAVGERRRHPPVAAPGHVLRRGDRAATRLPAAVRAGLRNAVG